MAAVLDSTPRTVTKRPQLVVRHAAPAEGVTYWLWWKHEKIELAMSEHATAEAALGTVSAARELLLANGFSPALLAEGKWEATTERPPEAR